MRSLGIIAAISLLLSGCTSQSVYQLPYWYRSRNCSISAWPEREWYHEGEEIVLYYCISCRQSQREPITENSVFNRIHIADKKGTELQRSSASYEEPHSFNQTFAGSATISTGSSRYYSEKTRGSNTFRHIVPGTYSGRGDFKDYKLNDVEFEFRVLAIPDSLKEVWDRFESLNRIADYNSLHPNSFLLWQDTLKIPMTVDALLDSAIIFGDYFKNRNVGSLWRYEALGTTLRLQSSLKDSLRISDRLHTEEFIRGYASESRSNPYTVIRLADRLLYSHLEPDNRAEALIAFAESLIDTRLNTGTLFDKRFVNAALNYNEQFLNDTLHSDQ